jgi:hypothetical protein
MNSSRVVARLRKRQSIAVVGIATGLLVAGTAAYAATGTGGFDSIYPSTTYQPKCFDGSYTNGVVCKTDGVNVSAFFEGTVPSEAITRGKDILRKQWDDPTDLDVTFPSKAVYSGDNETDIIYQKGPVVGSNRAQAWCDDASADRVCDSHTVRFSEALSEIRSSTLCHESGHAVGLLHGQMSAPKIDDDDDRLGCLEAPSVVATINGKNRNGTTAYNNRDQVNATY